MPAGKTPLRQNSKISVDESDCGRLETVAPPHVAVGTNRKGDIMWLVKWDENRVEDSGRTATTLALAVRAAKGMDDRFRRGFKRSDGTYHDSRTGITITEVISDNERYTVVFGRTKVCQYADKSAADRHASSIGGTVIVAKYNPERIVEMNHGSYYRKVGLPQAACSRKMPKSKG